MLFRKMEITEKRKYTMTQAKILSLVLCCLLLNASASFTGERITYEDFLQMDEEKQKKAANKSVKKNGAYFSLDYGNYITLTDKDPLYTLRMTVLMDDFYHSFSKVFIGEFKLKSRPTIYVLSDQAAYATALMETMQISAGWSAGMYARRGSKGSLFANASYGEEELVNILFHEGTHQLLHMYTGGSIPVWFNEGLATNFESFELTRSPENNRANSLYRSDRIFTLASIYPDKGYVRFNRLKEISSQEWSMSKNPDANYASAWVACNFFLGTEDGKALLNLLIKGFRSGTKASSILNQKMVDNIEKVMATYIEERILPNLKYGRTILEAMLHGESKKAEPMIKKMLAEYPRSKEAEFFSAWHGVQNGTDAVANLAILTALSKNKNFEHPELDFAMAQACAATGDFVKAISYTKAAIKGNFKHPLAPGFLNNLKKPATKVES